MRVVVSAAVPEADKVCMDVGESRDMLAEADSLEERDAVRVSDPVAVSGLLDAHALADAPPELEPVAVRVSTALPKGVRVCVGVGVCHDDALAVADSLRELLEGRDADLETDPVVVPVVVADALALADAPAEPLRSAEPDAETKYEV